MAAKKKPKGDRVWPHLVLVAVVTLFAFWPSLQNGFTNWDDDLHITANPLVIHPGWRSFGTFFSETIGSSYIPLTMASYALDSALGGIDAGHFHATNLALHLICTLLFFELVRRLVGRVEAATIAALLFGVHPLHVESVAWLSERKDLLSTLFYFAALIQFLGWRERRSWPGALLLASLLGLSLLSKGMGITFPLVATLIHLRFEGKLDRRYWVRMLPVTLISAGFVVLTYLGQKQGGSIGPPRSLGLYDRIAVASRGLLFYPAKALWPTKLSAFYPYPRGVEQQGLPWSFLAAPLVVALLVLVAIRLRSRAPWLTLGGALFAIAVAPVLQFVPIGAIVAADRYFYLPSFGIFLAVSAMAIAVVDRAPRLKWGVWGLCAALIVCGAIGTRARCAVWKDSFTLWSDVIAKFPDRDPLPYYNRGLAYLQIDNRKAAIADFSSALTLNEKHVGARVNRGVALAQSGQLRSALADFDRALTLAPDDSAAYHDRAMTRAMSGDLEGAVADESAALRLDPTNDDALAERAKSLARMGQGERARQDVRELQRRGVAIDPRLLRALGL